MDYLSLGIVTNFSEVLGYFSAVGYEAKVKNCEFQMWAFWDNFEASYLLQFWMGFDHGLTSNRGLRPADPLSPFFLFFFFFVVGRALGLTKWWRVTHKRT